MGNNTRRTTGAPLSMVLANDADSSYIMETRTLPRQPRPNYAFNASNASLCNTPTAVTAPPAAAAAAFTIQHQRTASANAGMQQLSTASSVANAIAASQLQLPPKNEHKLQYFDLDVANAPAISRQSMSVGNLNNPGVVRLGLAADPSARAPVQSSVVYNSVDFVKTEAFKRIREERKKENEGVNTNK